MAAYQTHRSKKLEVLRESPVIVKEACVAAAGRPTSGDALSGSTDPQAHLGAEFIGWPVELTPKPRVNLA